MEGYTRYDPLLEQSQNDVDYLLKEYELSLNKERILEIIALILIVIGLLGLTFKIVQEQTIDLDISLAIVQYLVAFGAFMYVFVSTNKRYVRFTNLKCVVAK